MKMSVFKNRIIFPKCFVTRKSIAQKMSTVEQSTANPVEYHLSQEEMNFYLENGYLVINQLFETKTLDNLRKRCTDICNNKIKSEGMSIIKERDLVHSNLNPEDYVSKIQDILHDSVFMTYSEDPRLLHVVSQFIGQELTALNSMLINKPPGSCRHPPHQDMYYFPVRPANIIASWTAIDPSTVENGCLYCIPVSHKLELLPHGVFQDSKKFFHMILSEDQHAPIDKRLYLELNPGDTVFFHPHMIHGSEANLSKRCRKSMVAHYMNSKCQFVDLTGTVQESILRDFEQKVQKKDVPIYENLWKLKSKSVKGVQCHL